MGSAVILQFFLPVSGLSLLLLAPHLSPRSFNRNLYNWEIGVFTVYQLLALSAATIASSPLRFRASSQPRSVASVYARQESHSQEPYGKEEEHERVDQLGALGVRKSDLTKAQENGFLVEGNQVIFPSTERIPKPPSGYRVMFLAFLLRGLSFPAHEFLRGILFFYGVQLHQLTPNSILHIAWFVTLCESFLGIEPHRILWKFLFHLRPSVSLSKNPELGRAVVSVHAEAHYLEFNMAASVQGWRKKWFYIKDQKDSFSDHYGIAPFDANKDLKKLSSWDSPPTEAEMEDIKPLLARIQILKSVTRGALLGMQLMVFFLQRCIQPLQHRVSKLWSYSGLENPSRVSKEDIDKKDLDKRVRALTTLTKYDEIPTLTADFFDFAHPLPAVCALSFTNFSFVHLLLFC
jgi:hypothetical protein